MSVDSVGSLNRFFKRNLKLIEEGSKKDREIKIIKTAMRGIDKALKDGFVVSGEKEAISRLMRQSRKSERVAVPVELSTQAFEKYREDLKFEWMVERAKTGRPVSTDFSTSMKVIQRLKPKKAVYFIGDPSRPLSLLTEKKLRKLRGAVEAHQAIVFSLDIRHLDPETRFRFSLATLPALIVKSVDHTEKGAVLKELGRAFAYLEKYDKWSSALVKTDTETLQKTIDHLGDLKVKNRAGFFFLIGRLYLERAPEFNNNSNAQNIKQNIKQNDYYQAGVKQIESAISEEKISGKSEVTYLALLYLALYHWRSLESREDAQVYLKRLVEFADASSVNGVKLDSENQKYVNFARKLLGELSTVVSKS